MAPSRFLPAACEGACGERCSSIVPYGLRHTCLTTVTGDQVEWSLDGGAAGKVTFKGTLDGATKMKGTAEYGQLGKGTFTAFRRSLWLPFLGSWSIVRRQLLFPVSDGLFSPNP